MLLTGILTTVVILSLEETIIKTIFVGGFVPLLIYFMIYYRYFYV